MRGVEVIDTTITGDRSLLARVRTHVRSPLYRNGYALTLSSGLTSVLGVVYWLLAARLYDASVVGANSAAVAAMMFLSGLAGLYLDGAFVRFVPGMRAAAARFAAIAYATSGVAALLAALAFLAGINFWSPALGFLAANGWLAAWFVAGVASWCIFTQQDGLLTGLRRTTWIPVENSIYAIGKLVLLVIFARVQPQYGIFASWTLPALLMLLPVNWLIFRRVLPLHAAAPRPSGALAAEGSPGQIVRYIGGNYVGLLFSLAYTTLPPILVLQLAGSTASAHFYLPWTIGSLMRLLALNMSTSLIVEASHDAGGAQGYYRRVLLHTLRLIVPLSVFTVIAAPYILHIFGPDYAANGATLLRLLALATIPSAFFSLAIGRLRAQNWIWPVVVTLALNAVITLGLSAWLLPQVGINGVGIAWLTSQTVAALFLFGVMSCKNYSISAPTA